MSLLGWIAALSGALAGQGAAPPPELAFRSTDPPFQITLPRGYARVDDKNIAHAFERSLGRESWEKMRVEILPLKRGLPQGSAPQSPDLVRLIPFGEIGDRKPLTFHWEDFDIEGLEFRVARNGIDTIVRCAWVPVSPESIGILVSAPTTQERELRGEMVLVLQSLKGATVWLTPREKTLLKYYRWPAYAAPALSGLFLAVWALIFRTRGMQAHVLRIAWHAAVVAFVVAAYFLLLESAPAREKLKIETSLLYWVLVLLPLFLFHSLMTVQRIRAGVEAGD